MVKPFFGLFVITLLTIPYLLLMSIVWFNGPPYLSLDVSQTRESTKWLWVGVVGGMAHSSPLPLPMGILYSSQFRWHEESKMAAHRTQQSTSMIPGKKRGL